MEAKEKNTNLIEKHAILGRLTQTLFFRFSDEKRSLSLSVVKFQEYTIK